jgi:hypothetical protein
MNTWIENKRFDLLWIIAPMAIPPLFIFLIPSDFLKQQTTDIFPWVWLWIVLAVDVTHVYATIYKTYLKPEAWKQHELKMKLAPLAVWMVGMLVYSLSSTFFWTCVTYFAVWHFIRQQYGFFRLYSRKCQAKSWEKWFLNFSIYAMTVLPILIWHARGELNFNWMTKNDFFYFESKTLSIVFHVLFFVTVGLYLFVEFRLKRMQKINFPRILLTLSTGFSYYISIVYFNNDFVFSVVNVLGHGIPYFALVWISERKLVNQKSTSILKAVTKRWGIILYYLILFSLAYFEESLWDLFVNREKGEIFGWAYSGTRAFENEMVLAIIVPLLIMPQIVHYILDAYIWRRKQNEAFLEVNKNEVCNNKII